jgi:LAO/AO transport system kinase
MGDDIQAIKAGILEVADIFVINKSDREGLKKTVSELEGMLAMSAPGGSEEKWRPPIVTTEATRNRGVPELLSEIETHKAFLFSGGKRHLKEHLRKRALSELIDTIKESVVNEIVQELENSETFSQMIDDVVEKRTDLFTLCDQLLAERFKQDL